VLSPEMFHTRWKQAPSVRGFTSDIDNPCNGALAHKVAPPLTGNA